MRTLVSICSALLLVCTGCVQGSSDASDLTDEDLEEARQMREARADDDDDDDASGDTGDGDSGNRSDGADSGDDGDPGSALCNDSCEFADDGVCDDGGPGSEFGDCALGADCGDCGPRNEDDKRFDDADPGSETNGDDGPTGPVCEGDEEGWPGFCGADACDASDCVEVVPTVGQARLCGGNPNSSEVAIQNGCEFEVQFELCFLLDDGSKECIVRTFGVGESDAYPGESGFYTCEPHETAEFRYVAIPADDEDACFLRTMR